MSLHRNPPADSPMSAIFVTSTWYFAAFDFTNAMALRTSSFDSFK